MSEALEVLAGLKKTFGATIGNEGVKIVQVPRLPTGIFQFDLATGGGFPMGRFSIIYGKESSGKTNLALLAIATAQRLYPHMKAVFIDVEHSFDAAWATLMGVDVSKIILLEPDYAEQAVDVVEAICYAEDVSIIVLDSIAALVTYNEIESDSTKQIVGGASPMTTKMCKKLGAALTTEAKRGHLPCIVLINQIRHKIGVIHGDPETTPGGNMIRFSAALNIRVYGKDVVVKEYSDALPTFKNISAIIKKFKVPVTKTHFEFDMCVREFPGCKIGGSPSWKAAHEYMVNFGVLGKGGKKGWLCFDEEYPTLTAIQKRYAEELDFREACQRYIVARELQTNVILDEQ